MTSSPFERQITEPDATERRTAAASNKATDGPQQFPPGPSFLEHDRPSVRLVELPAWLQAFAASVGEPTVEADTEPELELLTEAAMSADDKPASRSDHAASTSQARPAASGASFNSNFISEDDLPEWLRSIAPEEDDDSGADALLFGDSEHTGQFAVPNVTRAWTTSGDARGVDESTSLFALVASQPTHGPLPMPDATPAPRATARRTEPAPEAEPAGGVASYGTEAPPGMVTAEEVVASVMNEAGAEPQPAVKSGLPILPIAVAGVLLLTLVIVAVMMFVS